MAADSAQHHQHSRLGQRCYRPFASSMLSPNPWGIKLRSGRDSVGVRGFVLGSVSGLLGEQTWMPRHSQNASPCPGQGQTRATASAEAGVGSRAQLAPRLLERCCCCVLTNHWSSPPKASFTTPRSLRATAPRSSASSAAPRRSSGGRLASTLSISVRSGVVTGTGPTQRRSASVMSA